MWEAVVIAPPERGSTGRLRCLHLSSALIYQSWTLDPRPVSNSEIHGFSTCVLTVTSNKADKCEHESNFPVLPARGIGPIVKWLWSDHRCIQRSRFLLARLPWWVKSVRNELRGNDFHSGAFWWKGWVGLAQVRHQSGGCANGIIILTGAQFLKHCKKKRTTTKKTTDLQFK